MQHLPEELYDQIISCLAVTATVIENTGHEEQIQLDTLCRVSLVCKSFRRLARPVLFRTVGLRNFNCRSHRLRCFFRALVEEPELAGHVRVLRIDNLRQRVIKDSSEIQGWHDLQVSLSGTCRIFGLEESDARKLQEGLCRRRYGVRFAVLLFLCGNVEVLRLNVPTTLCESMVRNIGRLSRLGTTATQ